MSPCVTSCQSLEVTSLKLIDATNGSIIGQLNDGDTIYKGSAGPFSVRALVCDDPVGSVFFDLNGSVIKKENLSPHDINGGSVSVPNAWNPPVGTHTPIPTPYQRRNGNGTVGIAETVSFTVMSSIGPARISQGSSSATADRHGQQTDAAGTDNHGASHPVESGWRGGP
ncbi:MAG: hypothetical protein U5L96_07185 [Owenweeksia sp.]|nr:hypothetical protein [Owenweeksia sp.]